MLPERLRIMQEGLDPVRLLRDIRSAQQRLVALADITVPTKVLAVIIRLSVALPGPFRLSNQLKGLHRFAGGSYRAWRG